MHILREDFKIHMLRRKFIPEISKEQKLLNGKFGLETFICTVSFEAVENVR